jgi:hypothetical protein
MPFFIPFTEGVFCKKNQSPFSKAPPPEAAKKRNILIFNVLQVY